MSDVPEVLSVLQGRNFLGFAEYLGEVAEGREPQQLGNLGQRQVCFCQKVFAFLNAAVIHVVDGGDAVFPLEGMGQVIFVDVSLLRQGVQGEGLFEVNVDIPADGGALTVSGQGNGRCGHRQSGAAHEPDNENFHIGLTDILIAGLFKFHLPENVSQTGSDVQTFVVVQNTELSVGTVVNGQLDSVHAQNNVFQRLGIQTDLCVEHVGIDDYQMIGVDGIELIVDQKLSFSANYIKKLHMVVGMGNRVPVAAIFGAGNIQQFCGAPDGVGQVFVHCIMTSAHGWKTFLLWVIDIDSIYHIIAYCKTVPQIVKNDKSAD